MTEEELKKKCFQHTQAQLEQTFKMDTTSISSSKMSNKMMEELEKGLNQDSDEEPILEEAQNPNEDITLEAIEDYVQDTKKNPRDIPPLKVYQGSYYRESN